MDVSTRFKSPLVDSEVNFTLICSSNAFSRFTYAVFLSVNRSDLESIDSFTNFSTDSLVTSPRTFILKKNHNDGSFFQTWGLPEWLTLRRCPGKSIPKSYFRNFSRPLNRLKNPRITFSTTYTLIGTLQVLIKDFLLGSMMVLWVI